MNLTNDEWLQVNELIREMADRPYCTEICQKGQRFHKCLWKKYGLTTAMEAADYITSAVAKERMKRLATGYVFEPTGEMMG
ncbi:MAG: hypothetical protein J6W04_00740 [Bacteroidales bacterium]|nr:hypothetical protein [Bacteroidales bacterium]